MSFRLVFAEIGEKNIAACSPFPYPVGDGQELIRKTFYSRLPVSVDGLIQ